MIRHLDTARQGVGTVREGQKLMLRMLRQGVCTRVRARRTFVSEIQTATDGHLTVLMCYLM